MDQYRSISTKHSRRQKPARRRERPPCWIRIAFYPPANHTHLSKDKGNTNNPICPWAWLAGPSHIPPLKTEAPRDGILSFEYTSKTIQIKPPKTSSGTITLHSPSSTDLSNRLNSATPYNLTLGLCTPSPLSTSCPVQDEDSYWEKEK